MGGQFVLDKIPNRFPVYERMQSSRQRNRAFWLVLALGLGFIPTVSRAAGGAKEIISTRLHHLRSGGEAEWAEFAARSPEGPRLDLAFQATANGREATLFIRQDDVRYDWGVEINGKRLGKLFLMEADLISALRLPAGTLRDGENRLAIVPPKATDDVFLREIWIQPGAPAEAVGESRIDVMVVDADSALPIPARLTVVDQNGTLVPLTTNESEQPRRPVAVRPGVAYVGDAGAQLGLPAGDYAVHASRGFEYGVATQRIRLGRGDAKKIRLALRREVPTPGLVSCDPHVHTFTYSRHGDATVDERVLTVAGEGVELPILTDHNLHADFRGEAVRVGAADHFTPVTGNEVTTAVGHFNIFPVQPGARVPDFRLGTWPALISAMRRTPSVQIVMLNHPLNVHGNFQPFAAKNFNGVTGESRRGEEFSFDAIEVLNSSAQQSDFMAVYRGWFALLNYGCRITGVGSSDSHDVSRYIVGQGRTYIAAPDGDPARIDAAQAAQALRAGRALVVMGLMVDLRVDDRFGVGDLATGLSDSLEVTARVLGPSWVAAARVALFANGRQVREDAIDDRGQKAGEKARVRWRLPRPKHDVHLVAIATGPGVTAPFAAIPRPYQPTSKHWAGRVIGSTNPIWIDGDGDGRFTAARTYARALVERHGQLPEKVIPALADYDEAVAAHAASLLHSAGVSLAAPPVQALLQRAPAAVEQGFHAFRNSIRPD